MQNNKHLRFDLDTIINLAWPDGEGLRACQQVNQDTLALFEHSMHGYLLRDSIHCANDYIQIFDPLFPTYNANVIPHTHLIAAEGPCSNTNKAFDLADLFRFFDNTIFNPHLPVKQILALGYPNHLEGDFVDYFLAGGKTFVIESLNKSYQISSKTISEINAEDTIKMAHYHVIISHGSNQKMVDIFWLNTPDKMPMTITNQPMAELLLQVYFNSLKKTTLIHCAAGLGRTGMIILMFQILTHYNTLFDSSDNKEIVSYLKKLLLEIRQTRAGLISSRAQFKSAIDNALYLHQLIFKEKPCA